jgi:hypothetical protein
MTEEGIEVFGLLPTDMNHPMVDHAVGAGSDIQQIL